MTQSIHVTNEVGRLRAAIIHAPAAETKNYRKGEFNQVFSLRPMRSQFDLNKATREHAAFREVLEKEGVELLELTDLLEQAVAHNRNARLDLIDGFISTSNIKGTELLEALRNRLQQIKDPRTLVQSMCVGFRCADILPDHTSSTSLAEATGESLDPESLFINPLNTMFFTRDPATVIGDGVACSHMYWSERNREVPFYSTILAHHTVFREAPTWSNYNSSFHMEGGDLLNLDPSSILIGISQRTEAAAIDSLARAVLWNPSSSIDRIYATVVEECGTRLHLDTFVNRVDVDAFIIDPFFGDNAYTYMLTRGRTPGSICVSSLEMSLQGVLTKALGMGPLRFISCASQYEAECGAAGTLCLSPGKLCVLDGNNETNVTLERAGFDLVPISLEELTSGYGGPNCLCLPLYRDDI